MQRHWERTLHAEECLTISGDNVPVGESAVVISVCPLTHIRNRILNESESPGLFGLLPRSGPSDSKRYVG